MDKKIIRIAFHLTCSVSCHLKNKYYNSYLVVQFTQMTTERDNALSVKEVL